MACGWLARSKPVAAASAGSIPPAAGVGGSVMEVRVGRGCGGGCGARQSVAIAAQQVAVGVDAAVAEEGPDAPHVLAAAQVDFAGQHGGVATGLGDELALRAKHVAVAPELDAGSAGAIVGG